MLAVNAHLRQPPEEDLPRRGLPQHGARQHRGAGAVRSQQKRAVQEQTKTEGEIGYEDEEELLERILCI